MLWSLQDDEDDELGGGTSRQSSCWPSNSWMLIMFTVSVGAAAWWGAVPSWVPPVFVAVVLVYVALRPFLATVFAFLGLDWMLAGFPGMNVAEAGPPPPRLLRSLMHRQPSAYVPSAAVNRTRDEIDAQVFRRRSVGELYRQLPEDWLVWDDQLGMVPLERKQWWDREAAELDGVVNSGNQVPPRVRCTQTVHSSTHEASTLSPSLRYRRAGDVQSK